MSESYDFGINSATAEALNDYLALKRPEFAVLINGKWGCGKTWFIRKYFEEFEAKKQSVVGATIDHNKPATYCYVSLFDVENTAEIDKAILASANPLLKAKDSSVGRLGRAALDQVLTRFPIGVTPDDVNAVGAVLGKFFSKLPDPLILVLDDLERTKIEMELVLGYISSMLDQNGANVIVLCNEDKMKEGQKSIFQEFKEKVVGTTLTVEADFEGVYKNAIKITDNSVFIEFLNEHTELIKDLFEISKTDNLRNIRRIASEFLRVYNFIDDEMRENKEYLKSILSVIAMFSIEVSKGLEKEELQNNYYYIYEAYKFEKKPYDKNNIPRKDYTLMVPFTYYEPLTEDILISFFYYGKLDKSLLTFYKDSSFSNKKVKAEAPLRLWEFTNLSDEEFEKLYREMEIELSEYSYKNPGIILHAFGIKIFLAKNKIIKSTLSDIVCEAVDYINNITFDLQTLTYPRVARSGSSHGLGYFCQETSEFRTIAEHLEDRIAQQAEMRLKHILDERCELLPNHPEEFVDLFPYKNTEFEQFMLILDHFNAENMANKFTSLESSKIVNVFLSIDYSVNKSAPGKYIKTFDLERDKNITSWKKDFYDCVMKNIHNQSKRKQVIIQNALSEIKAQLYPETQEENTHA